MLLGKITQAEPVGVLNCSAYRAGVGVAEDPRRGAGDRGRTTRALVCRPPLGKTAPPPPPTYGVCLAAALPSHPSGVLKASCSASHNEKVPLVYKRSRQVGVSGSAFRTTPRVKSLNTLRVQA
ncbi:MAG: hypothetical protein LBK25_04000 [Treponema sp.]|nr:hypothetical protein [Treponema sp.]